MPEYIGGIQVGVDLGLSDFEAQLNQAIASAKSASSTIGSALQSGFDASSSGIIDVLNQIRGSIDAVGITSVQVRSSVDALGSSLSNLGGSGSGAQAASGITTLTQSLTNLNAQFTQTQTAAQQTGSGFTSFFSGLSGGVSPVVDVGKAAEDVAGKLLELGKNSLEAYADLERGTIALTALTGSATLAASEIAGLKVLAQDEALSFPELQQANQRLTALGVAANQIPSVLRAAADGAAAMNTSLINVTNAVDRMAASGSVAGRNLTQLGLTVNDLARVMDVATNKVSATFKALDESERVEVLVQALDKFQGTADAVANSLSGSFTRMENAITFAFQEIGGSIAPAAKDLTDFGTEIVPKVADGISAIGKVASTSITSVVDFGSAIAGAAVKLADNAGTIQSLNPLWNLLGQAVTATGTSFSDFTGPIGLTQDALKEATLAIEVMTDSGPALESMLGRITTAMDKASTSGTQFKEAWDLSKIAAGIIPVTSAMQGIIDAQTKAEQSVNDLKVAYDRLRQSNTDQIADERGHVASIGDVNRALQDLVAAQKKAADAGKPLADSLQADMQAAGKLVDNVARAQQAYDDLSASQDGSQKMAVALGIAQDNLNKSTVALANATDVNVSKFKNYGPAFDGLNKLLSEVSNGFRTTQQAVVDASTGDTAYVGVVTQLTVAQQSAYDALQKLYTLRTQWIAQGTNVKQLDNQVTAAQNAFEKAMESSTDAVGKHTAALKAKQSGETDDIATVGKLSDAHTGLAASMIKSATQITAGVQDESKAFSAALLVVQQLRDHQDGTATSAIALAEAEKQAANAGQAAGLSATTTATALDHMKEGYDAATAAAQAFDQEVSKSKQSTDDADDAMTAFAANAEKTGSEAVSAMALWSAALAYATSGDASLEPLETTASTTGTLLQQALSAQQQANNQTATTANAGRRQAQADLENAGLTASQSLDVVNKLQTQAGNTGQTLDKLVQSYIASMQATTSATTATDTLTTATNTAASSSADLGAVLSTSSDSAASLVSALTSAINTLANVINSFKGGTSSANDLSSATDLAATSTTSLGSSVTSTSAALDTASDAASGFADKIGNIEQSLMNAGYQLSASDYDSISNSVQTGQPFQLGYKGGPSTGGVTTGTPAFTAGGQAMNTDAIGSSVNSIIDSLTAAGYSLSASDYDSIVNSVQTGQPFQLGYKTGASTGGLTKSSPDLGTTDPQSQIDQIIGGLTASGYSLSASDYDSIVNSVQTGQPFQLGYKAGASTGTMSTTNPNDYFSNLAKNNPNSLNYTAAPGSTSSASSLGNQSGAAINSGSGIQINIYNPVMTSPSMVSAVQTQLVASLRTAGLKP